MRDLAAFALRTTKQLCLEFETSIDFNAPHQSFGKARTDFDSIAAQDNEKAGTSLESFFREEYRSQCAVLEASLGYQHDLGRGVIDDDEAAAIKVLPRATLETLLLTALDVSKNDQIDVFGPQLGPTFRAFVDCHRARRRATPGTLLLPGTVIVRRGGVEVMLNASQLLPGDVMLLKDGDRMCCDALLLDVAGGRGSCSIDTTILDGSSSRLARYFGSFVDCDRFGAASVLPQQSVLHLNCAVRGTQVVATAVALRTASESSWSKKFSIVLNSAKPQVKRELPQTLYVPPFPAVSVKNRHALVGMAACDVVIIDVDRLLVGNKSHAVDSCIWDSRIFAETDADQLWNYNPVQEKMNTSKDVTLSVQVSSFTCDDDASSRFSVVNPSAAFRELLLGAMMVSCYPPSQLAVHRDESCSEIALRTFLNASRNQRIVEDNFDKYRPLSDVTTIRACGLDVCARLFGYNKGAFANGYMTENHAALVVWGPAMSVAKLASYGKTSKGQQKMTKPQLEFIEHCSARVVAQPDLLIGIATADILLDQIGMKNSPSDVASLVSVTLNLSYLGAFACNPSPPIQIVEGIREIGAKCSKSCCLISFTQDEGMLTATLQRCGLDEIRVVAPDVLQRWKQDPPPFKRQACAFPLRGIKDQDTMLEEICTWLGKPRGLVFCAASSYGMAAMKIARYAVGFVSEDRVTSATLEMLSDVTVNSWDLVQLVDSIHGAMHHK